MIKPLTLLGLWILFSIAPINAQSTTGTRGLVKAPTARMFEDGTLSIGAAFIPPGYHKRTFGERMGKISPNAGLNTFITVNLFPFMEIMFRYTHELNVPVSPITRYFPDRMFTARLKLLEEKDKIPSIVLGLQDVTGTLGFDQGGSPHFSSLYLAASKQISIRNFKIDASIGVANGLGLIETKEFKGVFGGVQITSPYSKNTDLLIDYDTSYLNIGLQHEFFNRLHTMVSYYPNYQKVGWVLAYRYKMY